MGVGQQNKTAFIIQARMQSERLPGKILLPIPLGNGKPILLWIVEELRKSSHAAEIIIATSIDKTNDVLQQFCEQHGIKCFRGEEENVLSRFTGIAEEHAHNTLVRLTADNPIIDIDILDSTISFHQESKADYTHTTALPLGMNFEVIAAEALVSLKHETLTYADKEHVTQFLKNNDRFKKMIFTPQIGNYLGQLRLTVDYASDLLVVAAVLSFYNTSENNTGMRLVADVYKKYPFIFQVNQGNIQKKQFANEQQELAFSKKLLRNLDLDYTIGILEKHEKKDTI